LTKESKDIVLRVTGRVGKPLMLTMADIRSMETEEFRDVFIVCGTGTPRDTIKGCKGVFSWQEIFNTAIGGGVAVLTERDGKPLDETRDRIDLISTQDYFAGSRYVRDLRQIEVILFS